MYCVFLLVGVLFHLASGAEEPLCSRFSYDEALLEKTIRNEIKLETIQSEFMELREEVRKILETFQASVQNKVINAEESVENIEETKQKVESELREEIKTTLETFQANVQDKLNLIEESIKDGQEVKQKGDSIGQTIGFKATGVTKLNPSQSEVLIFPTVLLNKGDGYNAHSGIFTAPVSGLYLFTVQTCTNSGNDYHTASIMVQGKEMGRLFTRDYDQTACNSGNAIAYMESNGEAYIRTKYKSGRLLVDKYRMISFAGALLNYSI